MLCFTEGLWGRGQHVARLVGHSELKGAQGPVDVDVDDRVGGLMKPFGAVDGCEMIHEIKATKRLNASIQCFDVTNIPLDEGEIGMAFERCEVGQRASEKGIERQDLVALLNQCLTQ